MLLFDGHISHVNREFLGTCLDYKVLPGCLPPHTTHFSQPLDVSLFAPLKAAYSNILRQRTQAGERGVWKGNFYSLLVEAQRIAFTPENIRSGFWWTGLVPLDFEIIRRALNIPTMISTANISAITSLPTPLSPTPRPLASLSPTEIHAISTPRDHRTLHHLTQSLSLDLQGNTPRTWKLRHAFEKIANTGISAMHERDTLQERLQTATERARLFTTGSGQQPKTRKRRRIPEEGLIFRNKEELRQHFDEVEAKSREAQASKLQNLQKRAEKLHVRVRDLRAKKEKYRNWEREGKKLPATWKSVSRLEEEEQKEVERLQRLREDIVALEGEVGDSSNDSLGPAEMEGIEHEDDEREEFVFDF